jgi:hypothetical protein
MHHPCHESKDGEARIYFLCFFVFAPYMTAPAAPIIFWSSPDLTSSRMSSIDPTGLPLTRRIGSSVDDVKRARIGFRTSASSRTSMSIIVGEGLRYKFARMLLSSRDAGE